MNFLFPDTETPAVIYIVGDFRQALIILLSYLGAVNLLSFILYGVDKYRASRRRWRIPEMVLIVMAWIGGAAGSLLGMFFFHHKTRKWKFRILVPLALLLWTAALVWASLRISFT